MKDYKAQQSFSIRYCFLYPLFLASLVFSITTVFAASFNLDEISPGNYLHQGKHVGLSADGRDDIANIGFIIGERCVAVIDTGGSLLIGRTLLEKLKLITDKPVCFVINTHIHFDHVLGNAAFADLNPEFIGHHSLPGAMEANREFFLQEFSKELGPAPSGQSIIAPGKTVMDEMTVDLGNRPLIIKAHKAAHTHTDITVFDPETGTFWAGDLVFRERVPVIDGKLKGWLDAMEQMQKTEVNLVIPGHGPPADSWQVAMEAQSAYLNMLLNETREAIAEGWFMEEAINSIGTDAKDNWLLFDEHHRGNVSKAFVELEWE